jgi:hypothetical protein
MFDPRIYRAAFLPVIAAVAALMFSLEPAPKPLTPPVSMPVFEGSETARSARSIARLAPERPPGSEGDRAVADRVRETFAGLEGGQLSAQPFTAKVDGEELSLENVLVTLPGRRAEVLLMIAARSSGSGGGATTSAAATATLLKLAETVGNARHERTIVLASIPGGSTGSIGIEELVGSLPAPAGVDAAITLLRAGVPDRQPPFVFAGRSGPDSIPAALLATAEQIATIQFETDAGSIGAWGELARLALPVGIGPAATLAGEDLPAVAISGSGERGVPLDVDDEDPRSVSSETVFAVGTTALQLLLTLDETDRAVDAGPSSYLRIGDNLLPGWTLAVLALALVLPALLAAGDAWMRDRRRNPRAAGRALPWALERVLVPLAALLGAYALGLVGLIPGPPAAYEPGAYEPGVRAAVAFAALAGAVAGAALLIRPLRTPLDAEPRTLAATGGLLCSLAVLGIWLSNPFMALLLAPTAHVWLLLVRSEGAPRTWPVAAAAAAALAPAAAALAALAAALDLGPGVVWQLLLLIRTSTFGLLSGLLWCLLLGGLLACVAASRAGGPAGINRRPGRGSAGRPGPGGLGGAASNPPSR